MPPDGEMPEVRDGPPLGRPPKLVESDDLLKQIEGLARNQCTQREAAAVLRVHRDTFAAFLGTHEKAMEAWENGLEQGKASLRRMQFKNAENGNATMQVWLGKQWLDQKDRSEAVTQHVFSELSDSELAAASSLVEVARSIVTGADRNATAKGDESSDEQK